MSPIFSAIGQQEWFIVLDSNVLISNVKYVEELRDTNVKGKLQKTVASVL
jgi:chlorite dismutase